MIQTLPQTSQHAIDGFKHGSTEASRAIQSFFYLSQVIVNGTQGDVWVIHAIIIIILVRHCFRRECNRKNQNNIAFSFAFKIRSTSPPFHRTRSRGFRRLTVTRRHSAHPFVIFRNSDSDIPTTDGYDGHLPRLFLAFCDATFHIKVHPKGILLSILQEYSDTHIEE
jgi:hypothetical protein